MVEDEVIAEQLERLLTPAITNQENYYRKLGLRERILNLPLDISENECRDVAVLRLYKDSG
ncbi:MAG: hypothetical protein V7K67_19240 [Nostoc sp.]|uniref:hypothetical protein n=1 Tax=Nostoc sp. TaxID=1180 RepID=UPI002FF23B62